MKIDGLTLQTLRGWMGGSVVVQMVSPFHTVEGILHDADINTLMVKSNGQTFLLNWKYVVSVFTDEVEE
jgi:hypothetical protein